MDVVTPAVRSRMMRNIQGKNTKPEIVIRKALHHRGFRYRLHDKLLPGKPDIVLPRFRAIIFVNGCFWHGHNCHLFKWPKSNTVFWKAKITANKERDERNKALLEAKDWRVTTIWECSVKGKSTTEIDAEIDRLAAWIKQ